MAVARQPNTLKSTDAAYIAGLIDGEGTITLIRKHRNENRQLAISISNTETSLLDFVQNAVGAGKITNKRTTQAHHTPSYAYAIYNRQALHLLGQIFPWLRGYKAKRAELIIKDYLRLTPRNGKYTAELRTERTAFENAVIATKACQRK
jgi:hypothetical protein